MAFFEFCNTVTGGVIASLCLFLFLSLSHFRRRLRRSIIVSSRIDDLSGRAARQVARRAAEQQIVMHSDGGAIRPAASDRDDAGVGGGSYAPCTAVGVFGSVTRRPPLQVIGPASWP